MDILHPQDIIIMVISHKIIMDIIHNRVMLIIIIRRIIMPRAIIHHIRKKAMQVMHLKSFLRVRVLKEPEQQLYVAL